MVTEVIAEEVVPICEKHGVGKHQIRNRANKRGWEWRCQMCHREYAREYYAEPERRTHRKQYVQQVFSIGNQQITRQRAATWRKRYRLKPEDVLEMWEAQGRRCLFGGEPLSWEDIQVDHKHGYPGCQQDVRGRDYGCPKAAVRGLACFTHNTRQGMYEADPDGYMAIARWHVLNNGGKWTELCGCQEAISA